MKAVAIIMVVFALVSNNLVFGQSYEKLRAQLDSLNHLKLLIEEKLQEINKERDQVSLRITNLKTVRFLQSGAGISTRLKFPIVLFAEPSVLSDRLGKFEQGTPAVVTEYDQENDFWKIIIGGIEGFTTSMNLVMVDEMEQIRQSMRAQYLEKVKLSQIEREKKKKREAIEEKRRIDALEKKRQAAREVAIIARFGDVIGAKILDNLIWLGMTAEMARKSWGKPDDINRTVSPERISEQWIYERQNTYLYFENNILVAWQD